jgi:cell division initiation protein
MRLDREEIERRDFDRTLRGYDPEQVNAHLHRLAVAVSDFLDRLGDNNEELPPPARERLQAMVDATKIEGEIARIRAHEEAERILNEAREEAARIRAQAEREGEERVRDAANELSRILDAELAEPSRQRTFTREPAPEREPSPASP